MSTLASVIGWTLTAAAIIILIAQGIAGFYVRKDDDHG